MVQFVWYSESSVKWRKRDRGLQVLSGCFSNIPLWFRLVPNDSCEVGYICKMDLSEAESLTVLRLWYNTVQSQEIEFPVFGTKERYAGEKKNK